jgi:pimeloyl-ACP methyl ester carboxylesterase
VRPQTRYALSGDISIGYQVLGAGPFDLVYAHGWVSHLDMQWDEPHLAAFLSRLASFSRLITFDKRGTGLSDRVAVKLLKACRTACVFSQLNRPNRSLR